MIFDFIYKALPKQTQGAIFPWICYITACLFFVAFILNIRKCITTRLTEKRWNKEEVKKAMKDLFWACLIAIIPSIFDLLTLLLK